MPSNNFLAVRTTPALSTSGGVADESMSISKTHLTILRIDGRLYAVDRSSTNGTSIIRNGSEQQLTPGVRARIVDGDTIRFGDRRADVRVG